MTGNRTSPATILGLIAVGLVVLLANGRLQQRLQSDEKLNRAINVADMPPTLAITTMAAGPMRSLVANSLWWRAVRLQDEGNYHEAIQLGSWITALQPKLYRVWTYQAWNMSFNIAAEQKSPEEAWKWVLQGIELLRDQGLRYNPNDAFIHAELSRFFFQKIASTLDRHSSYYTHQWALIMSRYLETGRLQELKDIQAAPADRETLLATDRCRELVAAASALGLDLMDFDVFSVRTDWTEAQRQAVFAPEFASSLETLRRYHSRIELPRRMKLTLEHLIFIDENYGPFDWRLPQAHTVYWGATESYTAYFERPDYESPLIRQAMVQSFLQGSLTYLSDDDFLTTNNLAIAGRVHDYLKYQMEHNRSEGAEAMFKDFHRIAAVICYSYMYEDMARELFAEYRDEMLSPAEAKGLTFERFMEEQAPLLLGGRANERQSLISSFLFQAYVFLGLGDNYQAKGMESTARIIWQQHQNRYAEKPERQLPPFEQLKQQAITSVTSEKSTVPTNIKNALLAMTGGKAIEIEAAVDARPALSLGEDHDEEEDDH